MSNDPKEPLVGLVTVEPFQYQYKYSRRLPSDWTKLQYVTTTTLRDPHCQGNKLWTHLREQRKLWHYFSLVKPWHVMCWDLLHFGCCALNQCCFTTTLIHLVISFTVGLYRLTFAFTAQWITMDSSTHSMAQTTPLTLIWHSSKLWTSNKIICYG